jgi:putative endonuclease
MFYVYILESLVDFSYYTGYTKNLDIRILQHNSGKSLYTKRKMPCKLVYREEYENRSEAIKREKFLKAQRNKNFYQRLIKEFTVVNSPSSNK